MWNTNKTARIRSRVTRNGKYRTETALREEGSDNIAVTTDKSNATTVFIDFEGGQFNGGETVRLDGRQARTLYRVLSNHYSLLGKNN